MFLFTPNFFFQFPKLRLFFLAVSNSKWLGEPLFRLFKQQVTVICFDGPIHENDILTFEIAFYSQLFDEKQSIEGVSIYQVFSSIRPLFWQR